MKHTITDVKKGSNGEVTHYVLENGKVLTREEGVAKAKAGDIEGVIISHSKTGEEHLRSVADGKECNNFTSM